RINQIAAKNFPQDHRAVNNIGAVYFEQNKLAEAKTQFEKANAIKNNAIANNNLGAIAGVKGDRATAKELIGKSLSAGKDAKYNQGILDIMDGKYASAVSN